MPPGRSAWLEGFAYLTLAVLVGTFYVACAYFADSARSWGREGRWVSGFAYVYALALAGGFAIQLLAAVLLRWVTRATGRNRVVHWIGVGAVIGIALPWIVARFGYLLEHLRFPTEWQGLKSAVMFPLMAAMMYEVHSPWIQLAVGAATGGTVRLLLRHLISPDNT